jgi:hypothetical protein
MMQSEAMTTGDARVAAYCSDVIHEMKLHHIYSGLAKTTETFKFISMHRQYAILFSELCISVDAL